MNILVINGSPRKDRGNTERVLRSVADAAEARGAKVDLLYLADEEPEHCVHCGHPCFEYGTCGREPGATRRSERIQGADGLIIGSPVYCWQPNALTGMLFDKFRIAGGTWFDSGQSGIPALGIAVAGGTGTGVFPALQSIYSWFCAWRFSPLTPVPITRFNIDRAVVQADELVCPMLDGASARFSKTWEQMLCYDDLPFLQYGRIDEFRWLAGQMVDYMHVNDLDPGIRDKVTKALEAADEAASINDTEAWAQKSIEAYRAAYPVCRN